MRFNEGVLGNSKYRRGLIQSGAIHHCSKHLDAAKISFDHIGKEEDFDHDERQEKDFDQNNFQKV